VSTAIRVRNLSKQFLIGGKQEPYQTMRDLIVDTATAPFRRVRDLLRGQAGAASDLKKIFWALRDISFDIQQGEVVGVIGRNGAGKSTLLKVLSRITEPTQGKIWINGRVGSLLEVGTGFHQELTGRENIYLNGAILGMSRAEINARFDEIVAFAEVEQFIDTPVKHYSSGMYLRLAFAVAAHLETEILLVDEVLAVGDAAFQKKCLGKMDTVARAGKTVLLVSHNMGSVAGLAKKCLLLDQGKIVAFDEVHTVIDTYLNTVLKEGGIKGREGHSKAYYESTKLVGSQSIDSGGKISFEATIMSQFDRDQDVSLSWFLKNEYGTPLVIGASDIQYAATYTLKPGQNTFLFTVGPLPLAEGDYHISLEIGIPWVSQLDRLEDCLEFVVRSCRLQSEGHSIKTNWGHGSLILPFEIQQMQEPIGVQAEP
jgi:lipopolysaccharide transport system ATP-binding protein